MGKKIILMTGSELRHEFFRKFISIQKNIKVLSSYCESSRGDLSEVIQRQSKTNELRKNHLYEREFYEKDFFKVFCDSIEDKSNPIFIDRGEINNHETVTRIIDLDPDIILSYGCSIIRSELLEFFSGRFINIHLGLSPYYRGSGTNFWPFVNNELQFIGTTFMHIDKGVDTGEIIHQIRGKIYINDNIHQIGNRLIKDSIAECAKIIVSFDQLEKMNNFKINSNEERYYKKKDFTEESLEIAYKNLSEGAILKYLQNKIELEKQYPIIENPKILNL